MSDPIDIVVGERLRTRRQELGLSRQKLADGLGLTLLQFQKYERGMGCMAASTLVRAAATLHVPIIYFFKKVGHGSRSNGADLR